MSETATVYLFKPSGKYYTEEEWRVPDEDQARANGMTGAGDMVTPYVMRWSPDFRRIDGGAVLVVDQEPWGYPHLITAESEETAQESILDTARKRKLSPGNYVMSPGAKFHLGDGYWFEFSITHADYDAETVYLSMGELVEFLNGAIMPRFRMPDGSTYLGNRRPVSQTVFTETEG